MSNEKKVSPDNVQIRHRVPQGSIQGHLLFLVYVNVKTMQDSQN